MKKLLIWLMVILIAAVFFPKKYDTIGGVAGYKPGPWKCFGYSFGFSEERSPDAIYTEYCIGVPFKSLVSTSDFVQSELKGWKSYRNYNHKFEFQYPQHISLKSEFPIGSESVLVVLGDVFPSVFSISYLGNNANEAAKHLEQRLDLKGDEFKNLNELVNDKGWWAHKEGFKQMILDGTVAYKSLVLGDGYKILVEHNNGIYNLAFPSANLHYEYNLIGEQILSTFKFTK